MGHEKKEKAATERVRAVYVVELQREWRTDLAVFVLCLSPENGGREASSTRDCPYLVFGLQYAELAEGSGAEGSGHHKNPYEGGRGNERGILSSAPVFRRTQSCGLAAIITL